MVGTGVEKYSAEAADSINRLAEAIQYNAGYQADVTRSGGQLEAGNMRASGQRASHMAAIQGALNGQVAATSARPQRSECSFKRRQDFKNLRLALLPSSASRNLPTRSLFAPLNEPQLRRAPHELSTIDKELVPRRADRSFE
jgi:hypothetical protein